MTTRRPLLITGIVLLLLIGPIGAVWAVLDGLPAYGEGDESIGAGELLGEGTNLSAPLAPLLLFAIALALTARRDRWGLAADVVIGLVTLVFVVASIGEPFVPAQADSPGFLLVLFRLAMYGLCLAVIVLAIRDLRARRLATYQQGVTVPP